ncbi:MAG TPA: RidA family protein [Candidatus Dormibacteraeota bacterium]
MTNTARDPETIHPPLGAYSHQVEVPAGARLLVMAGQVGRTVDGRVPEDPIEQAEVALDNVRHNLEAAGMGVGDVVKLTWYVVGQMDAQRRRELLTAWLGDHRPASTLVYVAALAAPEYRVEIDAWACR